MLPELGCSLVGAFWLCLTTYVIFMVAAPKRAVTQGNLFTDSCLALKQGALKPVKSGKQTVTLFWNTFSLWVCKGFLWEDSSLLHSWVRLSACWKTALCLGKSLFQGIQFSEVQVESIGREGGREAVGGGRRYSAHVLMYTACSIS